jgi:hypothetical protein
MESFFPGTTVQNLFQFIQCFCSIRSQGDCDIFPKPQLTAGFSIGVHREQIAHNVLFPRGFCEFGRDGNFVVMAGEPFLRERRKQSKESVNVQHGQRPAATTIWLKDLESEESWWLFLIAAVGVPFKLRHGFRSSLVSMALEAFWGGSNVPEPTTLGAVGYWETVVVIFVKIGYQALQICAIFVVKPQLYLNHAFSFEVFMYLPQVGGIRGECWF